MRRAARRALQTSSALRNNTSSRCTLTAASQVLLVQRLPGVMSRAFSTADDAASNAAALPQGLAPDAVEENRFLELADTALHDIMSWLDGVEEMLEESDISLAVRSLADASLHVVIARRPLLMCMLLFYQQGVLKIDLGEDGTWVINRQIPNRQLWWSSPIRYALSTNLSIKCCHESLRFAYLCVCMWLTVVRVATSTRPRPARGATRATARSSWSYSATRSSRRPALRFMSNQPSTHIKIQPKS